MKMPVPSRKARDGTAATKPPCLVGGRFCSGRPFFGRAAVCSIQYQAESPPTKGFTYHSGIPPLFCWTTQLQAIIINGVIRVREWNQLFFLRPSGAGRHGIARSKKNDPQNGGHQE